MKDPNQWNNLWAEIKEIFSTTAMTGGFVAFIMALLQATHVNPDRPCWQRFIDAAICSMLAYVVIPITEKLALNIPYISEDMNVGLFIGVFIGYVGADQIRAWVVSFVEKKKNEL